MLFNSLQFAIFLPAVFLLYWLVFSRSATWQNVFLLGASVVFYAWADWRFLFVIAASTLINFYVGLALANASTELSKSRYLWLGIIVNIAILGYFKYANFFVESFIDLFGFLGAKLPFSPLNILLPLGVSFFTFQLLAYIIDLYNGNIKPCQDLLAFSVFTVYFPKLLAGPIERAQRFLPQIETRRTFNTVQVTDGLRQIMWGMFAKLVISNNCAIYANNIFDNYTSENGSTLLLGAFFYVFQIYGDFSGYSNIAIGVSKLLGISLMTNFATPFFSTNISDFWKKWHISLTTWMMDYVFNPLSFHLRRFKKVGLMISIICTFVLVGLWHGAAWKYILYGVLHGIYFIPLLLLGITTKGGILAPGKLLPSLTEALKILGLFLLVTLTIVLFRASTVHDAFEYLRMIFSKSLLSQPEFQSRAFGIVTFLLIAFFIVIEWLTRNMPHPFHEFEKRRKWGFRWASYYFFACLIFIFAGGNQPFIYFQF